jgi:hypothetical protein
MSSLLRQAVLSDVVRGVTGQHQAEPVRPVPPPLGVDNGQGRAGSLTRESLRARWQSRQCEWARLGVQVAGQAVCMDVLSDLELLWAAEDDAELDLQEAAAASGYSTDHLRRLARENRLPCIRRGRRMYFRAADVPRKSVRIDELAIGPYDPLADARRVAAQRSKEIL